MFSSAFVCLLEEFGKTTLMNFTKFGGKWHIGQGRNDQTVVVIWIWIQI